MDKQNTIIRQVARLPLETRKAIAVAIIRSIDRDENRTTAEVRFEQLVQIGEQVLGCNYTGNRKSTEDVYIRNMAAKVMRDDGYTYTVIGRAMHRDYTSVIVMVRRAADMEAGFYGKSLQDKYNEFMARI